MALNRIESRCPKSSTGPGRRESTSSTALSSKRTAKVKNSWERSSKNYPRSARSLLSQPSCSGAVELASTIQVCPARRWWSPWTARSRTCSWTTSTSSTATGPTMILPWRRSAADSMTSSSPERLSTGASASGRLSSSWRHSWPALSIIWSAPYANSPSTRSSWGTDSKPSTAGSSTSKAWAAPYGVLFAADSRLTGTWTAPRRIRASARRRNSLASLSMLTISTSVLKMEARLWPSWTNLMRLRRNWAARWPASHWAGCFTTRTCPRLWLERLSWSNSRTHWRQCRSTRSLRLKSTSVSTQSLITRLP